MKIIKVNEETFALLTRLANEDKFTDLGEWFAHQAKAKDEIRHTRQGKEGRVQCHRLHCFEKDTSHI